MDKPRTIEKKVQRFFIECCKEKLVISSIPKVNSIVLELLKRLKSYWATHMLHTNFCYTQLAFTFNILKGFYIVHDNTDASSVKFWHLLQGSFRSFSLFFNNIY